MNYNVSAYAGTSKLQNEINDVLGFLRANLFSIIDDLIRFIGSFSWLLWLNPKLTLLANAPAALLMWYTLYASKVIGRAALKSQQANANMTGFADMLITLFPITRLFDANQLLHRQYDNALVEWKNATLREEHRKAQLIGVWIAEGKMTFGDLTALFQYRCGVLVGAIMLTKSLMNTETALAGVKRVNETMQIPLEE